MPNKTSLYNSTNVKTKDFRLIYTGVCLKNVNSVEFANNICMKTMKKKKILKNTALIIGGGFVGLINGLLGGGGGTIVVPLYQTAEMETKKAHATAIATMLPLSIVSGAIYLIKGKFEVSTGMITMAGVILGGIIGALLLKKINSKLLSVIFYGVMVYAGIKMITK